MQFHFIIDLRAINKIVAPQFPIVPDVTTILTMILASATYFSVVDLKNAFFSIPIHKDSRYLFAFTLGGRLFTFTRAPQGYTESPSIYSRALKEQLDTLELPSTCALLEYVDDLLLAADSESACKEGTVFLLIHLAKHGHKA